MQNGGHLLGVFASLSIRIEIEMKIKIRVRIRIEIRIRMGIKMKIKTLGLLDPFSRQGGRDIQLTDSSNHLPPVHFPSFSRAEMVVHYPHAPPVVTHCP